MSFLDKLKEMFSGKKSSSDNSTNVVNSDFDTTVETPAETTVENTNDTSADFSDSSDSGSND